MSEPTETPKKKPTRASSAKGAVKTSAAADKPAAAKATAGKAAKVPAAKSEPVKQVSIPVAAPNSASSGKGAKARAQIADADAAESKTTRRVAGGKSKTSGLPNQDVIDKMVAEAAYYLAERRNFAAGFEHEDWLSAKEQIMSQLLGAKKPKS